MGNHPGSSPGNRTNYSKIGPCKGSVFLLFGIVGAVTGRVHRMTPRGGDIRCTRLGERLFGYDMLVSPTIAVRQVPVTGRVHRMTPQGGKIYLSSKNLIILRCLMPFLEKSGMSPEMTYFG